MGKKEHIVNVKEHTVYVVRLAKVNLCQKNNKLFDGTKIFCVHNGEKLTGYCPDIGNNLDKECVKKKILAAKRSLTLIEKFNLQDIKSYEDLSRNLHKEENLKYRISKNEIKKYPVVKLNQVMVKEV